MNSLEGKLMSEGDHLPKSKKEELFEQKVAEMKAKTGNIRLAPFNDSTWSKI